MVVIYRVFGWPEGITVWALFLTLITIAEQSNETRKSAEAARDSIRLQEAGMRQWVNIVPVGISFPTPPATSNTPSEVTLLFEIVNKTDYLVTILRTEISAAANVVEPSKTFRVDCNLPLVPHKSEGDISHPFYATTLVNISNWNDKGRLYIVTGTVTYLDCMDVERTQTFEDLYLGFMDGRLQRRKPSGLVPTMTKEDEQQSEAN